MSSTHLTRIAFVFVCAALAADVNAENRVGFWQLTTVESAVGRPEAANLLILPSGYPAIGYWHETAAALKFAWQDAAGWHTEIITPTPLSDFFSMVVLPSGDPALVYQEGDGFFTYGYRDGAGWHFSATNAQGADPWVNGPGVSLVALPSGAPAFSFVSSPGAPLILDYAAFDGVIWQTETIAEFPTAGSFRPRTELAVTPAGSPAVALPLSDQFRVQVRFAERQAAGWPPPELVADYTPTNLSLACAPSGAPVVTFATLSDIHYVERTGPAAWLETLACHVEGPAVFKEGTSLVFLPSGNPAFIFSVRFSNDEGLWFAQRSGNEWHAQQIVSGDFPPPPSRSLAVLPTGQPAVTYKTGFDLSYALGFYYGDLNCDGVVDFQDINAFVLALTDPPGYAAQYPNCSRTLADVNQDGLVNFHDINPFVALLTGA